MFKLNIDITKDGISKTLVVGEKKYTENTGKGSNDFSEVVGKSLLQQLYDDGTAKDIDLDVLDSIKNLEDEENILVEIWDAFTTAESE